MPEASRKHYRDTHPDPNDPRSKPWVKETVECPVCHHPRVITRGVKNECDTWGRSYPPCSACDPVAGVEKQLKAIGMELVRPDSVTRYYQVLGDHTPAVPGDGTWGQGTYGIHHKFNAIEDVIAWLKEQ